MTSSSIDSIYLQGFCPSLEQNNEVIRRFGNDPAFLQQLDNLARDAEKENDSLLSEIVFRLKAALETGTAGTTILPAATDSRSIRQIFDLYDRAQTRLLDLLPDPPAREVLRDWLRCNLISRILCLLESRQNTNQNQQRIALSLLSAAMDLGTKPDPEAVFSRLCQELAEQIEGVAAIWFTFVENTKTPIRPLFGAGDERIWKDISVPYESQDPLWAAIDSDQPVIVSGSTGQPPGWWTRGQADAAAIIVPFGNPKGLRGIGVIHVSSNRYLSRIDSALFHAFAELAERVLDLRDSQLRDPLTNLPNRRLFMDRLQHGMHQSQRRQQLMAIGIIDLDGFKNINDHFGHAAGDQVLMAVAKRIKTLLRHSDTLARLGGDEFGLVLTDLNDITNAELTVKRLLECLGRPIRIEDKNLLVGASIGLTIYPLDDADSQELLRHADMAMYQAKDAGRHTYRLFEHAAEQQRRQIMTLQNRLARALDSGQIEFHYQPKLDLARGHLFGVEALARWRDGELLKTPAEFITAIEESRHLSRRLGRAALFNAARQVEKWHAQGNALSIAVNIGAEHILDEEFIDDIDELLANHPHTAHWIELEVTERAALNDLERTREVLEACRERGLGIALDDFGTGNASLTYLQELPASQLKLDKRFVQKLLNAPRALAIVSGALVSAQLIGMEVVAEGTETLEQGELLLQLGCQQGQGFLISPPMPASELAEWQARWQPPAEWARWRESHLTHNDLALLLARTSHRHHLQLLLDSLASASSHQDLPAISECLDATHCTLGRWLRNHGKRYSFLPEYVKLTAHHDHLHELALNLALKWRTRGGAITQKEIDELRESGRLLDMDLAALIDQIDRYRAQKQDQ